MSEKSPDVPIEEFGTAEHNQPLLLNPYIAGKSISGTDGFFGREDILRLVIEQVDSTPIVLSGPRRIGKTSILKRLEHRLAKPFTTIRFDLQDRAEQPLGKLLAALAGDLATAVGMTIPRDIAFDDAGSSFRQSFLPRLYAALGPQRQVVLLLDEFDVVDAAAEKQLPPQAAAHTLFPYLRLLMEEEPRLRFVVVVGRKPEQLSTDFKATFKAARFKRVSVLEHSDAVQLIRLAERQKSLRFLAQTVDAILALTSGHPYFTQLVCQLLWSNAHQVFTEPAPLIEPAAVEAIVPAVLEAGENVFEWIWDGLPPTERVIFAAIAEATRQRRVVTEDNILEILGRNSIRLVAGDLDLAPRKLVDWEMLRPVEGGYSFFIDLMRRWVLERKPLQHVKEDVYRINPFAEQLYKTAQSCYQQADIEGALELLRKALEKNTAHLPSRILRAQIFQETNRLSEAVNELEEAYKCDEQAVRYRLVGASLAWADKLEHDGQVDKAKTVYERVHDLSPTEPRARERLAAIWIQFAAALRGENHLDEAFDALQRASFLGHRPASP